MRAARLIGAAAAALGAMAGSAAQGAVVAYVYAGEVSSGVDQTGVFGEAGRNLAGLAFTATFRRNDAASGVHISYDTFESFIRSDPSDGAITASLTIDGVTWNFAPGSGEQSQYDEDGGCGPGCDVEAFGHALENNLDILDPTGRYYARDGSSIRLGANHFFGKNLLPSLDYRTLPEVGPAAGLDWFGDFEIDGFIFDSHLPGFVAEHDAFGSLEVHSLRISQPVPEPATWALMILGFGSAGAMLRARRRSVAA